MRLINTRTLELEDFVGKDVPPYAILSHTWGDDEVSFQDWQDRQKALSRAGFEKIRKACEYARLTGLEYIWIDTNCIDKSSSAELSEAINSMFVWYERSQICLVYLCDVTIVGQDEERSSISLYDKQYLKHTSLSASRWFTRGWTLQELLAPNTLVFVSDTWQEIGRIDKMRISYSFHRRFIDEVSSVTGIGRPYLLGIRSRYEASIALRMSWAASRRTTRVEDIAYCLLGLFNINMPLLYGEGTKAFQRLQQEIMRVSTDQSIFAWEWVTGTALSEGDISFIAPSPSCFARSRDFVELEDRYRSIEASTFTLTNTGLSLRLPIHRMPRTGLALALLQCSHRFHAKIDQYRLCIPVRLGPKSQTDGTHICERLEWPPLPLCITIFSSELHHLHIPRKAPRPHSNFEGIPTELLYRNPTQLKGCIIFLLFPASKQPYTVKKSQSSSSQQEMNYDSIGMFDFKSWEPTSEHKFVSVVVEIEHENNTAWIQLEVYRAESSVFRVCRIIKTKTYLPHGSRLGITPAPWRRKYTIKDAIAQEEGRDDQWWDKEDKESRGNWLVEMGAQAIDSTGMITVPVYITCGKRRAEPARALHRLAAQSRMT